jgi:hypothetical protein
MIKKETKDKLQMDLIRPEMMIALAAVLQNGAKKYAPHGFMDCEIGDYKAALLRHFYRMDLEPTDKESGLPHSWHVLACAAILVSIERPTGEQLLAKVEGDKRQ